MPSTASRAIALPTDTFTPLRRASSPVTERSFVHAASLAFVWLTVAAGALVFMEPAPVDLLMFGLFVLLPVVGLTASKPFLSAGWALWLVVVASGLIATVLAREPSIAGRHMALSLYLAAACMLIASFVAKKPEEHTKLILNAYLAASVFAAVLGIAGYLNLFPGAAEYFTRYDRATATFKDPNVYGPFLICGLLAALHNWLTRPAHRGFLSLVSAGIIAVGILFSFSRGAWMAAAIAIVIYAYLYAVTAPRNWQRVKLAALILVGATVLGLVLAAAFQSDSVGRFLADRAALTQSYDAGAEGRFGGQLKAFNLILENPLGLGSLMFSAFHHPEEVHNVYLSMLLNAGWVGGLTYLIICAGTLALGFQHALRRTRTQPLFLIVYAALAANILEGIIIDTDHWRHFYMLLGVVWGLMAGDQKVVRSERIVADRRPVLLRQILIIPTSTRGTRIIRKLPPQLATVASLQIERERRLRPKRAPRIVQQALALT